MNQLKRNVVFSALCLFGIAAVCANFLPREDISDRHPDLTDWSKLDLAVEEINDEFSEAWTAQQIRPAPVADAFAVMRRVSLALTGTVPSLEDIRAAEKVAPEVRVMWWTDHLLADRRSSDYLAERFARAYVGTEEGPFLVYRRRRFVTWLSDQFHENKPYDQLVRELISSSGLWTDTPAVNFLTVTNDVNGDEQPDEERLAARTTRAFLGVRLDCVQCHDDHLDGEWLQQDFQQLAAFYTEARSSLLGVVDKPGTDYEFTFLNEETAEIVPPKFPFCKELEVDGATRRQRLANWVTHSQNRAFARAAVNRVWALMFGKPLVATVDNVPLEGPFPPGLEKLADLFIDSRYDMRQLIRAIVLSRPFQSDSQAPWQITPQHEMAWAAFPITRLRPEQVAGAIIQSCSLTTVDADSHIIVKLSRYDQQNKFVERYGDTGEDEFGGHGGTIPQRLLLLNGDLVADKTKEDLVLNAATRIAALAKDDETAVRTAYWAVLTREPTSEELEHFLIRIEQSDRREDAVEDMFWVLLNSAEFAWNH